MMDDTEYMLYRIMLVKTSVHQYLKCKRRLYFMKRNFSGLSSWRCLMTLAGCLMTLGDPNYIVPGIASWGIWKPNQESNWHMTQHTSQITDLCKWYTLYRKSPIWCVLTRPLICIVFYKVHQCILNHCSYTLCNLFLETMIIYINSRSILRTWLNNRHNYILLGV